MLPHTAWNEGAQRAARYQHEAAVHHALAAAGLGSPTRRAVARLLRGSAEALARTADRLVPPQSAPGPRPAPRSAPRRPAANA